MVRRGDLPAFKFGKAWYVRPNDLERVLTDAVPSNHLYCVEEGRCTKTGCLTPDRVLRNVLIRTDSRFSDVSGPIQSSEFTDQTVAIA